jgi:hypothetical protein
MRYYNAAMSKRFQFSMRRMMVAVALACISVRLFYVYHRNPEETVFGVLRLLRRGRYDGGRFCETSSYLRVSWNSARLLYRGSCGPCRRWSSSENSPKAVFPLLFPNAIATRPSSPLLQLGSARDNARASDFQERRATGERPNLCECAARIVMTASKSPPMTR